MKYNEWKLINEALQGAMTLGLAQPQTLGGPIGSKFVSNLNEEDFEDDDDEDEDEDDDDDYDGQQTDDDEGLEGDLVGSSLEDEGPDKGFPPDSAEEEDGLPTPDEEMLGGDEFGGEGDDLAAALAGGDKGGEFGGEGDDLASALAGDMGGEAPMGDEGEPDMGFLDDLPTDILDRDPDEAGEEHVPGTEEPCFNCNPDGQSQPGDGDPNCEICQGEGWVDDVGGPDGDEFGPEDVSFEDEGNGEEGMDDVEKMMSYMNFMNYMDKEGGLTGDANKRQVADPHGSHVRGKMSAPGVTMKPTAKQFPIEHGPSFMKKMAKYMQKYMRKEWSELQGGYALNEEMAPPMTPPMGQPPMTPPMGQTPMAPPMGQPQLPPPAGAAQTALQKKMISFMSKKGMRKFMAADAPRKAKKKDHMCHCPCESSNEFLNSLCRAAQREKGGISGISEDALFALADPNAEYAQGEQQAGISAGSVGFAPQGRVGSIGGGYTQDDVNQIPVMGESVRYPTLTEYAAMKARKRSQRRR